VRVVAVVAYGNDSTASSKLASPSFVFFFSLLIEPRLPRRFMDSRKFTVFTMCTISFFFCLQSDQLVSRKFGCAWKNEKLAIKSYSLVGFGDSMIFFYIFLVAGPSASCRPGVGNRRPAEGK